MINQTNSEIIIRSKASQAEDAYGLPVYTTTERIVTGLIAWGSSGMDFGVERNTVTTQATLYLPANVMIEPDADFIISGDVWRQDGEQVVWQAPSGWSLNTGSVISLTKVEG